MRVLVIGSGGREHAICDALSRDVSRDELFCLPGNPGIEPIAQLLPGSVSDIEEIVSTAVSLKIEFVIVGPELPLSLGIVDALNNVGILTFGPTKAAAQIESSKAFAKQVMEISKVPTAASHTVTSRAELEKNVEQYGLPVVLKADGLAAGKGVFVCITNEERINAIESLYEDSEDTKVVIEEFLEGVEASFIVAVSGTTVVPLALSHDYKRIGEGNTGQNTGGMGTVSPTPFLDSSRIQEMVETVIDPVVKELQSRGIEFCGFLYAGLMIEPCGRVKVLEYNARLGDPETQVIMTRLESSLVTCLHQLAKGQTPSNLSWKSETAVCVVQASSGYPKSSRSGDVITGLELVHQMYPGVSVFHAGTALDQSGNVVTNGGRVLGVVALGDTIDSALDKVYKASDLIQFAGRQMRRDIGASNQCVVG